MSELREAINLKSHIKCILPRGLWVLELMEGLPHGCKPPNIVTASVSF